MLSDESIPSSPESPRFSNCPGTGRRQFLVNKNRCKDLTDLDSLEQEDCRNAALVAWEAKKSKCKVTFSWGVGGATPCGTDAPLYLRCHSAIQAWLAFKWQERPPIGSKSTGSCYGCKAEGPITLMGRIGGDEEVWLCTPCHERATAQLIDVKRSPK